jgi:hypothetical protein
MPEIKITGVVDTWMIGISELGEGESMRAKMLPGQAHATTVWLDEIQRLSITSQLSQGCQPMWRMLC